jgi:cytochrome c oxidase subunit 3
MTSLANERGLSAARNAGPAPAAHGHPPHLAHHFDTPKQQFEASKMGMWLFLGTEVLLFGGLFCLYVILRFNHPEMFHYGSRFLAVKWGAINTVILILSSLTMAIGVTAAQRDQRWWLVLCLALTFLGGAGFMGIKYVEYSHKIHENLVWGTRFYEDPHPELAVAGAAVPEAGAPDPKRGAAFWMATCRSCHGPEGRGIPGQGKDMRGSTFIAGKTDAELLAFVKVGRMPFDPLNTTGIQMPPRGGNPMLKDNDLRDVIAFLRTLDLSQPAEAEVAAPAESEEFYIPRWVVPEAPEGPRGLNPLAVDGHPPVVEQPVVDPRHDPQRPQNAHLFFAVYFLMTGLHGVHVVAGMAVIAYLTIRAALGHFGRSYFTPVDLGGLYWHVVDLIWIFLFPLFYLIG